MTHYGKELQKRLNLIKQHIQGEYMLLNLHYAPAH